MQLYCLYLLQLTMLGNNVLGYGLREGKQFIGVDYMLSMEESFNIWGWGALI